MSIVCALLASNLRQIKFCRALVLAVTSATAGMIVSGSHQSPQRLRDATQLMMADILLDACRTVIIN